MTKFRNRGGRRGPESRGPNQQQRPSGGSRDGTPGATQGRRGGRGGGSTLNRSSDGMQNGSSSHTAASTPSDDHVPMTGYNSGAVEAMLKQGYDARAPLYKPEAKTPATKPESPWGAKPGAMVGGKDFWLELRKQVAALQQSGGTSRGG
ncbi:hypothetical protein PV08_04285 [Exophiala spinifera]|uniref:Uncharacterized protein n=1 Tax=Exophiala spinifera TaxID=91928 RepID=A0A0D2C0F4_9EURO|nr:uncharacterized protein PV08_04285 [Exophiala spinifera]KIW17094.1 hypothetical protein PV08_04285 [Exophiala spinifera]